MDLGTFPFPQILKPIPPLLLLQSNIFPTSQAVYPFNTFSSSPSPFPPNCASKTKGNKIKLKNSPFCPPAEPTATDWGHEEQ